MSTTASGSEIMKDTTDSVRDCAYLCQFDLMEITVIPPGDFDNARVCDFGDCDDGQPMHPL